MEKDFKIEYDESCYILSLLKSKKELAEDKTDAYNVKGYYTQLPNAINAACNWRLSKKYPFNEPTDEFKKQLLKYKKSVKLLTYYSELIYAPLFILKKKIFDEYAKL
jgi:hypothetical protein